MGSFGKCRTIRHIVRLRQMLRRWRARACCSTAAAMVPPDVPAGHVAVCVGASSRRFIVRTAYLSHPLFRSLLLKAEEEYGFDHAGPLTIPCDEAVFEQILRRVSATHRGGGSASSEAFLSSCHCHLGGREGVWHDSRPLLRGLSGDSSVW